MELRLGLALTAASHEGLDLNCHVSDAKEVISSDSRSRGDEISDNCNKKRGFDEAFEAPETLPFLLLWNNQPNEDDDDREEAENNSLIANKNDDGNCIVGWPPLKSRRKKICSGNRGNNDLMLENAGAGIGGGGNYKYVKVKMEGVAIARKVDLRRHNSYQTLTSTLINMFGKCQQDVQSFKLAYQDKEGDWLLAGDLPWRSFIQSAERLKLLKKGV